MNEVTDNLKFRQYKYIPQEIVLTIAGEDIEFMDGSITYVNIIHQYTTRHLPVIQVGMEIETQYIAKLYDNVDDSYMRLKIIEELLSEDSVDKTVVGTSPFIDDTFSIIPMFDRVVYITTTDPDSVAIADNVMKQLQNFEFYLIDLRMVNYFDQEFADHNEMASYAGSLQHVFMAREIPPELVVCTPPMIEGKLKDITIPLDHLINNIDHLNTTYGLWDGEPLIYYDLQYLYCIAKVNPNIQIKNSTEYGTVTFTLYNPEKSWHSITGSCNDADTRVHWINLQRDPHVHDTTSRDTNAKMSTLTTVNAKGEVEKTTLDESATRLKYVYSNNALTSSQITNETMIGPIVSASMENVSVKFLKPYKDYTFEADTSYENLDLNGHIYRLLGWSMSIKREGSVDYLTDVSVVLYNPTRE